jgi:hypothetical protein
LTPIIVISAMILAGFVLMYAAIFSKKKDIEKVSLFGIADILEFVFNLLFAISSVTIKRILIFILGLLLSGFFLYILITGKY